jgi:hypothetical protein
MAIYILAGIGPQRNPRMDNRRFRRLPQDQQLAHANAVTDQAMASYRIPRCSRDEILSEVWIALAEGDNPLNAVHRWKRAEAKAKTRERPISNLGNITDEDAQRIQNVYGSIDMFKTNGADGL